MKSLKLSDYYFLRAFSQDSYAKDFFNGKIYMSAISNFKNNGNKAQKDESESILLRKQDGVRFGYIFSQEKPTSFENMHELNDIKCMFCDCYALCFFLIPKSDILIENGQLLFKEGANIYNDLSDFLQNYGNCVLFIVDAESFVTKFDNCLNKYDIKFQRDQIVYCEDEYAEKIKQFDIKCIEKLNFIKSSVYSKENEYRYIIKRNRVVDDHIIICCNDIDSTIIWIGKFEQ